MQDIMQDYKTHLDRMINTIISYGVKDKKVLKALKAVPRHFFVPGSMDNMAWVYADSPLPIGNKQTISQPYTVAYMLELLELKKGMNILEIGAGSGWNAALIKHIVGKSGKVTALEYIKDIAELADKHIKSVGLDIEVINKDGRDGCRKNAPYDRIIASCACPKIMPEWRKQLKKNGIIVAPVGKYTQKMTKLVLFKGIDKISYHGEFSFVPLLGGNFNSRIQMI